MNGINAALRNVGWALLRIAMGGMFLTHGYAKIFGVTTEGNLQMANFQETVRALGLPWPEVLAWVAALSELVGGGLIVIGLLTRPASLFAMITMAVAVFSSSEQGFAAYEKPLMYLVVFFVMLLGGSGPVSFDEAIRARRAKASSTIFK